MARNTKSARLKANRRPTFLREWRKEHAGLTLDAAAERLVSLTENPLDASQLSRVERGESPYSQDLLEALAVVYKCEPADMLMGRPGDKISIATTGLNPDQVKIIEVMVEQMRRTRTGG